MAGCCWGRHVKLAVGCRRATDRGANRWPGGSLDQWPPYGEPGAVPRRLAATFADDHDDGLGGTAPGTATAAPGRAFRRRVPKRPPSTRQRPRGERSGCRSADPPRDGGGQQGTSAEGLEDSHRLRLVGCPHCGGPDVASPGELRDGLGDGLVVGGHGDGGSVGSAKGQMVAMKRPPRSPRRWAKRRGSVPGSTPPCPWPRPRM